MSSGKGGGGESGQVPKELGPAFQKYGNAVGGTFPDFYSRNAFLSRGAQRRINAGLGPNLEYVNQGNTGIDDKLLRTTFGTGGFAGFTEDDLEAFASTRGLSPSDPALSQAAGLFGNNAGSQYLQNIDLGSQQNGALSPLRSFDSFAQQGLNFQGLQDVASGKYLDVANNPHLSDALANAQRQTTENYSQNVAPALASQFGGGFGLTGSASINAQRRAAEDLNRSLSEQATSTYANQYNLERGHQEGARSLLNQLQLQRAQGIDSNRLSRAQGIADTHLGFSNANIGLGSSLGNLQNQSAQGIANIGAQRRAQELQRISALNQAGQQQRQAALDLFNVRERAINAPFDQKVDDLGRIGGLLGAGAPFAGAQVGGQQQGSRLGNAIGGAASGAAAGSVFGVPGAIIGGGLGGIAAYV